MNPPPKPWEAPTRDLEAAVFVDYPLEREVTLEAQHAELHALADAMDRETLIVWLRHGHDLVELRGKR